MNDVPASSIDLREQFERLSNWGRWGDDDQLGTINYITPRKVLRALRIPRNGVAVGLGHELGAGAVGEDEQFSSETTQVSDASTNDEWRLSTHGYGITHMDALGHSIFEGRIYGDRAIKEVLRSDGLTHGSIAAYGSGVITRGVLLDVARARGIDYLDKGDGVSAADLENAAKMAGIDVEPGDAIFVRVGLGARRAVVGFDGDDVRTGVLPEVTDWLHHKQIAVYSGDCIERLPSEDDGMSHPLHQVGQVSMGLCTLDIPDMERLADTCRRFNMPEFLLVLAPLRVMGASGSPVNPLAVF